MNELSAEQKLELERRKKPTDEQVDEASRESFPASDPPAAHGSDAPPANASAKWKTADAHVKPDKTPGR